jgi:amino acid adenylation domain-containing protein
MQTQTIQGYQLSPQQKRIWQLQGNQTFCAQVAVKLEGSLNREKLKTVIANLSGNHEILRTSFQQPTGMKFPLQVINQEETFSWQFISLENSDSIEEIWNDPPLENPLNATLIQLQPEQHLLVLSLPSLCADYATLNLLIRAIRDGYAGETLSNSEEVVQYLQVSEWQNELLVETDESDWSQWQTNEISSLKLPTQKPSNSEPVFADHFMALDQETLENLQTKDIESWLLTVWQVLLWRLTGQSKFVIHYATDGRFDEELIETFGNLRKWVPLESSLTSRLEFQEVVKQTQNRQQEAFEWQLEWNGDREFEMGFAYNQWSSLPDADGISWFVERVRVEDHLAPLQLIIHRTNSHLYCHFRYDQQQFNADDIERVAEEYLTLLTHSLQQPRAAISQLPIVGDSERQQLLVNWNQTQRDFGTQDCLHQRIAQQAETTPDAIALRFGGECLTYQQLNEQANQVAHYLQQQGVTTETLVGISLERSLEAMISFLGILKAGAAYVPLDPGMPKSRLSLMLEDAPVALVLTQSQWQEKLPAEATQLCLDTHWSTIAEHPTHNPTSQVQPHHLAYVIFTSGSTGKPKGVAVEHRAIMNYVDGIRERLQLPQGASYATVSTLAADLGNTAVFGALCTGGTLHILSQEQVSDPVAFTAYCQAYPIDCLKIVPSHLAVLLATGNAADVLPKQQLILGGETATWDLVRQVQDIAPNCQIFNHYGPTESTIGVLTYPVTTDAPNSKTVPLGRPLPNTETYVLDDNLNPVPIGVPGELYIGGAGLAREYYNQPELTAQRFIPHPFQNNARLYKTGDRVCYHPDGTLEFLGRVDQQIKIRGFRIELGEIEARLMEHPQIEEAVVATRTDEYNTQHLDAYFSPSGVTGEDIRNVLRDRVPDYMIPDTFTPLSALPRTASGKVDRQSLPEPDLESDTQEYIAPRNSIESAIAQVFADLLHLEQVSVTANFFDLGGHSLLATQVISRLRSTFAVEIPLHYLFEAPTIADLAEQITQELAQQSDVEQLLSELEQETKS